MAKLQVSLKPGQYSFEVKGKAQGVEFFQITGKNYSKTYKLLNLGGVGTDEIRLEGSSSFSFGGENKNLSKSSLSDSIRITYTDTTGLSDTLIQVVPFANGNYEVQLNQIPEQSVTNYIGSIILVPSGNWGAFLNVLIQDADTQDTLKVTSSDNLGSWFASFYYDYWTHNTDTLYENENIKITISGENIITKDTTFAFTRNLQWIAYVQQVTGQGTANGSGHLTLHHRRKWFGINIKLRIRKQENNLVSSQVILQEITPQLSHTIFMSQAMTQHLRLMYLDFCNR